MQTFPLKLPVGLRCDTGCALACGLLEIHENLNLMCSTSSNTNILFKLHLGFWDLVALKATSNLLSNRCSICCCLQFSECLENSVNIWLKKMFFTAYRYTVIMFSNNRKWEKALDLLWPWKRLNIWQKHTACVIPDWNMFAGACVVKHLWHTCVSLPVICLSFFVSVWVWFGSAQRDFWPQKVDVGAKSAFTRSLCYLSARELVEICGPWVCACVLFICDSKLRDKHIKALRDSKHAAR